MIVVDASVVVEFLLNASSKHDIAELIAAQESLAAPELIEYEVGSVLRRLNLAGKLSGDRGAQALQAFGALRVELYPVRSLSARVWELRHNVTYYDGSYLALAEALDLTLYTSDRRLASVRGHSAKLVCFDQAIF